MYCISNATPTNILVHVCIVYVYVTFTTCSDSLFQLRMRATTWHISLRDCAIVLSPCVMAYIYIYQNTTIKAPNSLQSLQCYITPSLGEARPEL